MKNLKSILFATAFLVASMTFANTDESTPISGTYTGTLETKTFLTSNDATKAKSDKDFGVDLLFNGNVFIYQSNNAKAMGTYTMKGDVVSFEVTSVKGNEELVNAIFSHEYQFSKKGSQLMLIGNAENRDVTIMHLRVKKGENAKEQSSSRKELPVHVYLKDFKTDKS